MKNNKTIIIFLIFILCSFNVLGLHAICPTSYDVSTIDGYLNWTDHLGGYELNTTNIIEGSFEDRLILPYVNNTYLDLVSYRILPICGDEMEVMYTDYFNTSIIQFDIYNLDLCDGNPSCNAQDVYIAGVLAQQERMFGIDDSLQSYLFLIVIYIFLSVLPFVTKGNTIAVASSGLGLIGMSIIIINTSLPLFFGILIFIQAILYLTQAS